MDHRLHLLRCNLTKTALLRHTIATAEATKALLLLGHTIATEATEATEALLLRHTKATKATETLLRHTIATAEAAKTTEALLLLGHTEATTEAAKTTKALLGHRVKALPRRLESTTEAALWLLWLLWLPWLLGLTAKRISTRVWGKSAIREHHRHLTYLS